MNMKIKGCYAEYKATLHPAFYLFIIYAGGELQRRIQNHSTNPITSTIMVSSGNDGVNGTVLLIPSTRATILRLKRKPVGRNRLTKALIRSTIKAVRVKKSLMRNTISPTSRNAPSKSALR